MIFGGYEPGSKGYQFWDAAHHWFKISHDVKFDETLFPVKEGTKSWKSMNDPPISLSDNKSEYSGLEISSQPNLPHDHPAQVNLQPTPTHPLLHQWLDQVLNIPYWVNNLHTRQSQNQDIPCDQQVS